MALSGPSENHVKMVEHIFEQYDQRIYVPWSCRLQAYMGFAKMVTDMVQEKFGMPTLYVDLDAIDGRYKSGDEIKAQIAEYFETVVLK